MSRRPSIVITYPYPIGQKSAGGSRTTREVAIHLTRGGADVVIMPVSTNPLSRRFPRKPPEAKELGSELDPELEREGVEVIRPEQNPFLYQLDGTGVKKEVAKILRQRHVDLVLGHFHEAAFLPAMLKRKGVKFGFLATWQTYADLDWTPKRLRGHVRRKLEDRLLFQPHRAADIHFAISEFTRRELIEVFGIEPSRIVVCPLGVEPSFLEVPRQKPEAITRFIFFGRIAPSKGFREAIEALGMVKKRGITDWTYRMYGSGRTEWAREAAAKHGVADHVEIFEPVDTAGLGRALSEAHLAILPSYVESFGHSIVEAQASGIPVVAFDSGSVPEVVQDGVTGWLGPLKDVDALADNIERAVKDPEGTYQAGLRARERVRETYSWTTTARIILETLGKMA